MPTGAERSRTLTRPPRTPQFPSSFSPDGKTIAYTVILRRGPRRRSASRSRRTSGSGPRTRRRRRPPRPGSRLRFAKPRPPSRPTGNGWRTSPTSRARRRSTCGPIPDPDAAIKVSTDSGIEPVWTRGGRSYRTAAGERGERFMVVEVADGASGILGAAPALHGGGQPRGPMERPGKPGGGLSGLRRLSPTATRSTRPSSRRRGAAAPAGRRDRLGRDGSALSDRAGPRATRREWIGLAVIALPCVLYSMDLTVLNLALPALSEELRPAARSCSGSWTSTASWSRARLITDGHARRPDRAAPAAADRRRGLRARLRRGGLLARPPGC